jgi:hypothetical protein
MLEVKRQDEERTGIALYPEPDDVLIGRSHPYHIYSGTCRLLDLIESKIDQYYRSTSHKFLKTCIDMEVVKNIKESGGRFLTWTKTGWKILDDTTAREKTANLFRYRYNLSLGKTQSTSKLLSSSSMERGIIPSVLRNKRSRGDNPLPIGLHDDKAPNKFPLIG